MRSARRVHTIYTAMHEAGTWHFTSRQASGEKGNIVSAGPGICMQIQLGSHVVRSQLGTSDLEHFRCGGKGDVTMHTS